MLFFFFFLNWALFDTRKWFHVLPEWIFLLKRQLNRKKHFLPVFPSRFSSLAPVNVHMWCEIRVTGYPRALPAHWAFHYQMFLQNSALWYNFHFALIGNTWLNFLIVLTGRQLLGEHCADCWKMWGFVFLSFKKAISLWTAQHNTGGLKHWLLLVSGGRAIPGNVLYSY